MTKDFKKILSIISILVFSSFYQIKFINAFENDEQLSQIDLEEFPALNDAILDDEYLEETWNKNDNMNRSYAISRVVEQRRDDPEIFDIIDEVRKIKTKVKEEPYINRRITENTIFNLETSDNKTFFDLWESAESEKDKENAIKAALEGIKKLIEEDVPEKRITSEGGEIDSTRNNRIVRYLTNLYQFIINNKSELKKTHKELFAQLKELADEVEEYLDKRTESKQAIEYLKKLKKSFKKY